jgi:hypothetical protein
MRRAAPVLGLAALAFLAACGGGSPSATPTTSTTGPPTTTTPSAPACSPSSVSASIDFTKFGGTSSSLAGAVVFSDTAGTACALHGVPQVRVLLANGQTIPIYQAPAPAPGGSAILTPTNTAASSITFSSWTCETKSFSLTVRFAGWTSSVPAAPNASSGTNTTTPCSDTTETDQTVYMGPVVSVGG